ncbi:MAG TPA: aspartate/glutamate racemase family protein [Conexibacter sp.]|jgi:allantoin racemase
MSEIVWVNPVQGDAFDGDTLAVIDAVRAPHHVPRICHLEAGPPHLEYHLYEHAAFGPMLELFRTAERDGCAAAVIGCFYDGGLREAREALTIPVVGMGEASMLLAATLGHRFSIIVGRRKWIPKMTDNAVLLGLDRRLASFRSVELGMPDFLADPAAFFDRTIEEGRRAVEQDGAEVVVLSELTSPEFCARAREELPVPVVDPGMACWKWAEMAAELYERAGLTHVSTFGYEAPPELVG